MRGGRGQVCAGRLPVEQLNRHFWCLQKSELVGRRDEVREGAILPERFQGRAQGNEIKAVQETEEQCGRQRQKPSEESGSAHAQY